MLSSKSLLLWLTMSIGCLAGEEVSLIRVGDAWRYFIGVQEASAPATAWQQVGFDDSAWAQGVSGFSSGADEATYLSYFPVHASVFFRRSFTLEDPARIKWLALRLNYDAGFVAYLNGVEVLRRGLTGSPVPYSAYATYHPRAGAADFDLGSATNLLVAGTNVLALQVHCSSSTPYTLAVTAELLGNFVRGPFVQNVSTNQAQVIWRTVALTSSGVEYGTTPDLGNAISDPAPRTNHAITLPDLQPGTRYYYRAISAAGAVMAQAPVFSFRTLTMSGDVAFEVLGDSGGGTAAQYSLARVLASNDVDLVLHVGDVAYPSFNFGNADTRCGSVYGLQARSVPFFFTCGNHEFYANQGATYLDAFYLPTNSANGTKYFYSFDHGDVHFVCLYVPMLYPFSPSITNGLLAVPPVQYNWLTNDLAHSAKPWKIAWFHSPLTSSATHRDDDANYNNVLDRLEIQATLLPVFRQYGVQASFHGHDHDYEKLMPLSGTSSFISGGGGYNLYDVAELDAATGQFWHRWDCLRVHVQGDTMRVEALDDQGQLFDTTVVQRAPPTPQVWPSAWHTPAIASGPANDGDGNISGQRFDFDGTPIPTLTGEASNLGEVLVNNDLTTLYVGFRHTMVAADQDITLFIESPRLPGVTTLAGLGNGTLDPDGQGADGLDMLKNLSFTNFHPAIACLLGDEFADGQLRSFARPAQTVNTGQGIFRLDSGFSDVAGASLQQFNQSPQVLDLLNESAGYEQNADFIQVAIPYAALGGLQPGDTIRLGAVVGGTISANDFTRNVDRGFLGQALHGSGSDPVLLEGLQVRLADVPASEFKVLGQMVAPGLFQLTWPAVVGASYQVEYTGPGPFKFKPYPAADLPLTAQNFMQSYLVDLTVLPPDATASFFRVRRLR